MDTNGICICLQLLNALPDIKVCFTTEEEIGFLGAQDAAKNVDFFYNVKYMIQPDRRGNSDLITWTNGIHSASDEFVKDIKTIMEKYNYKEAHGIGTDIGELSENLLISGVNVSCGYKSEHTDQEETNLKDLENCLNFIRSIIKWLCEDKVYDIKLEYQYYSSYPYNRLAYGYGHNQYIDPDWDRFYNEEEEDWNRGVEFQKQTQSSGPSEDIPCDHCKDMDCMHCKFTW